MGCFSLPVGASSSVVPGLRRCALTWLSFLSLAAAPALVDRKGMAGVVSYVVYVADHLLVYL